MSFKLKWILVFTVSLLVGLALLQSAKNRTIAQQNATAGFIP